MKSMFIILSLLLGSVAQANPPKDNPEKLRAYVAGADAVLATELVSDFVRWESAFHRKAQDSSYPGGLAPSRRVAYWGVLFEMLRSKDAAVVQTAREALSKFDYPKLDNGTFNATTKIFESILAGSAALSADSEESIGNLFTYIFLMYQQLGVSPSSNPVFAQTFNTPKEYFSSLHKVLQVSIAQAVSVLSLRDAGSRADEYRIRLLELLTEENSTVARIAMNVLKVLSDDELAATTSFRLSSPKEQVVLDALETFQVQSVGRDLSKFRQIVEDVEILTVDDREAVAKKASEIFAGFPTLGPSAPEATGLDAVGSEEFGPPAPEEANPAALPPSDPTLPKTPASETPVSETPESETSSEMPSAPVTPVSAETQMPAEPTSAQPSEPGIVGAPATEEEPIEEVDVDAAAQEEVGAEAEVNRHTYPYVGRVWGEAAVLEEQRAILKNLKTQLGARDYEQAKASLEHLKAIFPGPSGEGLFARTFSDLTSQVARNEHVASEELQSIDRSIVLEILAPALKSGHKFRWVDDARFTKEFAAVRQRCIELSQSPRTNEWSLVPTGFFFMREMAISPGQMTFAERILNKEVVTYPEYLMVHAMISNVERVGGSRKVESVKKKFQQRFDGRKVIDAFEALVRTRVDPLSFAIPTAVKERELVNTPRNSKLLVHKASFEEFQKTIREITELIEQNEGKLSIAAFSELILYRAYVHRYGRENDREAVVRRRAGTLERLLDAAIDATTSLYSSFEEGQDENRRLEAQRAVRNLLRIQNNDNRTRGDTSRSYPIKLRSACGRGRDMIVRAVGHEVAKPVVDIKPLPVEQPAAKPPVAVEPPAKPRKVSDEPPLRQMLDAELSLEQRLTAASYVRLTAEGTLPAEEVVGLMAALPAMREVPLKHLVAEILLSNLDVLKQIGPTHPQFVAFATAFGQLNSATDVSPAVKAAVDTLRKFFDPQNAGNADAISASRMEFKKTCAQEMLESLKSTR